MKALGQLLIAVGFLAGALVAVQNQENLVDARWFVPALLIGVAGVVMARLSIRAAAREGAATQRNLETLTRSIDQLVQKGERLEAEKDEIDPYEARDRIDADFREDLHDFAEARETLGHVYGLSSYADIMSHFAAGERYLNRVWSASIDGYVDEVHEYIGRALEQFREARSKLRDLEAARPRPG